MIQGKGGNLSRVKLSNYNAIRRVIYQLGPINRSEISARLELTLPTITTTINNMIANGLVRVCDTMESGEKTLGRRAYPVDIELDRRLFAGVEIRGAHRRACVTDYRGNVLFRLRDETPFAEYGAAMESAAALVRRCLAEKSIPAERIVALGVTTPGLVDREEGFLRVHPGYGWTDKPILADIAEKTGFAGKIAIENNVCARAYAAQLFHRGLMDDVPTFTYLFVSSGIACPFLINTWPAGTTPIGVGEVGHMVIAPNGPRCSCGHYGCLEALSSEKTLIARCAELMQDGQAPILSALCAGKDPTVREILAAYEQGDVHVAAAVEKAIYYLGLAMANVDNLVRPYMMLFDGEFFSSEAVKTKFLDHIKANLYRSTLRDVHFRFIPADDFSGALGACAAVVRWDLNEYVPE